MASERSLGTFRVPPQVLAAFVMDYNASEYKQAREEDRVAEPIQANERGIHPRWSRSNDVRPLATYGVGKDSGVLHVFDSDIFERLGE